MQIKIAENVLVPLGQGKYIRADHIIVLEPIEMARGTGNRTRVLIDHSVSELLVGRTETTIVRDMREREEGAIELPFEATPYVEAMEEIHAELNNISPAMRAVLKDQGFDVDALISRITSVAQGIYDDTEKEDILA